MSGLVRSPNLRDPDGFYAALVAAHEGLSDEAGGLLNARLVLILANHLGDHDVLSEALALARASLPAGAEPPGAIPRTDADHRPRDDGSGEASMPTEDVALVPSSTGATGAGAPAGQGR